MTTPDGETNESTVPPLSDLLARYLQRQAAAHGRGLGTAEVGSEVTPYEAIPIQSLDPRLAWHEAIAVASQLGTAFNEKSLRPPPDWPAIVAAQEPTDAVAFCFGNFPQLVRNLQGLLQGPRRLPRPNVSAPLALPGVMVWAEQTLHGSDSLRSLLVVGVLRLARQFDRAEQALLKPAVAWPAECQAAVANEQAALAWSRGQWEQADSLWRSQLPAVPVLFNRGMAALFLDRRDEARTSLRQVVERLPDTDGWHHLGRLYLALAEMVD